MPPKHSSRAKKLPAKTLARKEAVAKEAVAKFSAKKAAAGKSAIRGNTDTVAASQTSEECDTELADLRGEQF